MNPAYIDLVSVFFIALTAAFSHCIGMCGGIVLAYSQIDITQSRGLMAIFLGKKNLAHSKNLADSKNFVESKNAQNPKDSMDSINSKDSQNPKDSTDSMDSTIPRISPFSLFFVKFLCHLLYGFGRITTYMIIGGIAAYIGSSLSVNQSTKGGIFIAVGLIIIIFGILMLKAPKIISILEPNIGFFKRFFLFFLRQKRFVNFYALGVLNGAFPCGIVYFFALSASVSGSVLNGALVMLVFGVATMFPLTLLGIFSTILNLTKYKNVVFKIAIMLVIAFGIWTIFKGFRILFS